MTDSQRKPGSSCSRACWRDRWTTLWTVLAEKNVLSCRVFRRAKCRTCTRVQSREDPRHSSAPGWLAGTARPCSPSSDARVPGAGESPEGWLRPARRGCPLPSHVAWWVGTDLKLEKIRAIPTSECPSRSSRSRIQFERGAPGGARRWELVKPSSGADGGTPGMAQLSVIPGSATAWTGALEPAGGGGRRAQGRSETACPHPHPTHTSSRSRGCWAPTTGGAGWVKRP